MLLQFLATASRLPVFFSYTATTVLHLFLISKQFLEKTSDSHGLFSVILFVYCKTYTIFVIGLRNTQSL